MTKMPSRKMHKRNSQDYDQRGGKLMLTVIVRGGGLGKKRSFE